MPPIPSHAETTQTASATLRQQRRGRTPSLLVALSVASFLIKYATAILIARALGVERYDRYAIAIATVVLIAPIAELGLGKYALKVLPIYQRDADLARLKGYLHFASAAVLGASVSIGLLSILSQELAWGWQTLHAPAEATLFLPVIALVGVAAEVATAIGSPRWAAIIHRVLVPAAPLGAVIWVSSFRAGEGWLEPRFAILFFGSGWVLGLVALALLLHRTLPREVSKVVPSYDTGSWLSGGMGMAAVVSLIGLLVEGSLILASWLDIPESDLSIYAVCLETAAFSTLLMKSVDKYYLPRISSAIHGGRLEEVVKLRGRRDRMAWGLCLAFMTTIVGLGPFLLSEFGAGFVRGYAALVMICAGVCAWTLASLSQWVVLYIKGSPTVIVALLVSLFALLTTGSFGATRFGLEGLATSLVGVLSLSSLWFSAYARALLRSRAQSTAGPP